MCIRDRLATHRYCAGLYDPGSGHLHPLNYTLGLARAAEAAGVRIFESSAATSILPGDPVRITTARGTVSADFAVLARGGYVAGLRTAADWLEHPERLAGMRDDLRSLRGSPGAVAALATMVRGLLPPAGPA